MTFKDSKLVQKIIEDYKLQLTVRPDGMVIGFSSQKAKLRRVYEIRSKKNEMD